VLIVIKNCVDGSARVAASASCCEAWPTSARFAQKWKGTVLSVAATETYLIQLVKSEFLAIIALATDTCAMIQKCFAALEALALLAFAVRSATTASTAQTSAHISKTTAGITQTQQLVAEATNPTSVHIQTSLLL
jgi:hypothetical protein